MNDAPEIHEARHVNEARNTISEILERNQS